MEMSMPTAGFGYVYTGLATIVIAIVIIIVMSQVGRMRAKHDVQAPDTVGPDEFNYAFRAHMNTVEQAVLFLPVLWLFAATVDDMYAGIAGGVWAIGRLMYAMAYWKDPAKRSTGFLVSGITTLVAAIWSLVALIGML